MNGVLTPVRGKSRLPEGLTPGAALEVSPMTAETRTVRILVVEDNDLARKQLQQLLQALPNFQVDAVSDGEKAVRILDEQPYSLVLTDLRLPGVDGLELIRSIQQKRLPVTVIVMTLSLIHI